MKILFLNYEYPPLGGGAANATKYLLEEYSKHANIEVDLITSAIDKQRATEEIGGRVRIYRLPIGKNAEKMRHQSQKDLLAYSAVGYKAARRLMQQEKYDVIHAFFGVPCGFMAMVLSQEFKVPYIVSLRGSDVPGYSERFAFIYKLLTPIIMLVWGRAKSVVSNSKGLKELALKARPKQEIPVIYNGVDVEKFTTCDRSDRDTVRVLCASRLMKRKGFKFVIEAVAKLREKYPQLRLEIAGGYGDASDELRTIVKELNLKDVVEFSGEYQSDGLPEIQHRSDIFVFPSFNEGMSNSMLEAMAGGLPVIMTPTGGAEELICDCGNGYLVKFGNSDDIAQKIEKLLKDSKLRHEMGQRSREIAENMSWKSVSDKYIELYKQVIRAK